VNRLPLHPSLALSIEAIRELIERALDQPLADAADRTAALRFAQHGLSMLCQALEDQSEWWLGGIRQQAEFFMYAPDACLLTDAAGIIRDANPAAAELFGVQPPKLANRPLAVFIPRDGRAAFRSSVLGLAGDASGQPRRWPASIERATGARLAVEISVRPVNQARQAVTRLCWLLRRTLVPVA
jgi:PAS domain S-box-containing protein